MRTLHEILEAAKGNDALEVDEARYALCALSALNGFDARAIERLAEAEKAGAKPFLTKSAVYQAQESHQRWHLALNKSPKEYCGESYDPANPEYQKLRKASRALWEKIATRPGKTS